MSVRRTFLFSLILFTTLGSLSWAQEKGLSPDPSGVLEIVKLQRDIVGLQAQRQKAIADYFILDNQLREQMDKLNAALQQKIKDVEKNGCKLDLDKLKCGEK